MPKAFDLNILADTRARENAKASRRSAGRQLAKCRFSQIGAKTNEPRRFACFVEQTALGPSGES